MIREGEAHNQVRRGEAGLGLCNTSVGWRIGNSIKQSFPSGHRVVEALASTFGVVLPLWEAHAFTFWSVDRPSAASRPRTGVRLNSRLDAVAPDCFHRTHMFV